ncbi:MAG: hypothetical protein HQK83_08260 [Fibrobacteria bacterium]|nr:hypothetical protein [Fibrobacteria bacterium]
MDKQISIVSVLSATIVAFIAILPVFSAEVEHKPVSISAFQEMGMLESGVYYNEEYKNMTDEWIDHFGTFVSKEIVINDRLHLYGGLGGIFEFRKPEVALPDNLGTQRRSFFIGPARTEAVFHFGDIDTPFLKLGAGMFSYKYNPEASNLGEYLFRTRAYPNLIMTGGYAVLNNAVGYLQGFKSNLHLGNFKLDLFFGTETSMPPLYDFSLGAVAEYSILDGFLTLGAGINMQGLVSVDSKRTAREKDINGYIYSTDAEEISRTGDNSATGKIYSTYRNYYTDRKSYYETRSQHFSTLNDSARAKQDSLTAFGFNEDNYFVADLVQADTLSNKRQKFFSSKGTILMGRITLDPKPLFSTEIFGSQDLKIFAEAAVLGWENFPIFYTDRTERIPIMFGFNFPGFKLLDLISVQFEYYNSSELNNTFAIGKDGANIPIVPIASDSIVSNHEFMDIVNDDNWKWSILIKKQVLSKISLSAQFARDHMRNISSEIYYGPQFDPSPYTIRKEDWYWMFQVAWGI